MCENKRDLPSQWQIPLCLLDTKITELSGTGEIQENIKPVRPFSYGLFF